MAVFALVHGSWHGAWCWERLEPELDARGHRAVAIDLPIEDPNAGPHAVRRDPPRRGRRRDPRRALVRPLDDPARRPPPAAPASRLPLRPRSGAGQERHRPLHDGRRLRSGFVGNTQTRDDGASYWPDPEAAIRCFYHDCTATDAAWAASRLRAQAASPRLEPWPVDALPDVERSSILCRDERVFAPAWSRTLSRVLLGVERIVLEGGHSPFLSRPAELANVLVRLG